MFKRRIYDRLLEWKKSSKGNTAVLVEGARRIGKTTVVREFAEKEYDEYLLVDFGRDGQDVRDCFDFLSNMDVFFRNLFLAKGKRLKSENAVIVFDEVQLFPPARQAIKYLVEDGRYDYIETGSLISIKRNVKDILIPSEEESIKMYPMDFEEFLWACGDTSTIPLIQDIFLSRKGAADSVHRKLLERFRTYMVVGGMPQAVDAYVSGANYRQIDKKKRMILKLYDDDLKKYDEEGKDKASRAFRMVSSQLSSHNSVFKLSKLDKNARYDFFSPAIQFVSDSMIVNRCNMVTAPDIALESYQDERKFKLYMGDTGLLVTQMMMGSDIGDDLYKALIFNHSGVNQGIIFENIVAQELVSRGYTLYFHEFDYQSERAKKQKKYELDFLIVKNKKICPIEVKSSGYSRHASFDCFIEKYPIRIKDKYIITVKNLKFENGITYLPFYMMGAAFSLQNTW